jgi:hypothetical protein
MPPSSIRASHTPQAVADLSEDPQILEQVRSPLVPPGLLNARQAQQEQVSPGTERYQAPSVSRRLARQQPRQEPAYCRGR